MSVRPSVRKELQLGSIFIKFVYFSRKSVEKIQIQLNLTSEAVHEDQYIYIFDNILMSYS